MVDANFNHRTLLLDNFPVSWKNGLVIIFICFFHVWEWTCCNPQNNWVYKASHILLLTPQKLFCNISSCIYSSIPLELAEVTFFHKRYEFKTAIPCSMFQYVVREVITGNLLVILLAGAMLIDYKRSGQKIDKDKQTNFYWLQEIWKKILTRTNRKTVFIDY